MRMFIERRLRLAAALPTNTLAIIPAAKECIRNGDAHYRFRQSSDFYYLTGFNEPDALLCIESGTNGRCYLFNRPKDPKQEQWTGARLGQQAATAALGVSQAYPIDVIATKLPEILNEVQAVYVAQGANSAPENIPSAWLKKHKLLDLSPILHPMRLIKDSTEISNMRNAAKLSVAAHLRAMRACKNLHHEYELEAELVYEFTRQGSRSVAYDSIVAAGSNACILHYTDNNQRLLPNSLVLVDAAGEFNNYAADITRTYPVSGRFTPAQLAIYTLVLQAQRAGMHCVRPGGAWQDIQHAIVRTLTAGLLDLNLLTGNLEDLIANAAYRKYYMHNSGHWLGLDVHDPGSYQNSNGSSRTLEPGMVLTVEPGLYLPADDPDLPVDFQGIGVRIEDDLVVTADGFENLTAALPVEPAEIEALICG